MSKFHDYPKYKYHANKKPIVVAHEEEEKELGEEWKDSPADHVQEEVEQEYIADIPCIEQEVQKNRPGRKPKPKVV